MRRKTCPAQIKKKKKKKQSLDYRFFFYSFALVGFSLIAAACGELFSVECRRADGGGFRDKNGNGCGEHVFQKEGGAQGDV